MSLPRYQPMLATAWPSPFEDPAWSYELKWDGVRTILYWDGERTELRSRAGNDVTGGYPEVARFAAERPLILDGEIVALGDDGTPSFERLQSRMHVRGQEARAAGAERAEVSYVAFDLLYLGEALVERPVEERQRLLAGLDLPAPFIASEPVADGAALWDFVVARDLEGMVAKRRGSPYRSGARSPDWRKMAHTKELRAVVGGYTPGEGGRAATLGSLAVGLWTDIGLRLVGTVGSGLGDRDLVNIRNALDEMTVADCPFVGGPDLPEGTVWVEPQLVAAVRYKEMTRAGRLRAPVFVGFRSDPPESARWETYLEAPP